MGLIRRLREWLRPTMPSWSLADLRKAAPVDVLLVTVRDYQYRELGAVGRALAARGRSAAALDLADDPDGPLARAAPAAGLPVIDRNAYARGHCRPGVLVVRTEAQQRVRDLLVHANRAGIPTVAIAHPVVNFTRCATPYVLSRKVLCAGPFTARRFQGPRLVITGFPGLDEMPEIRPNDAAPPRVLVNLLRVRHEEPTKIRDRWMGEVEAACRAASLPLVVSCHPRDVGPRRSWPVDTRPVYDLLAEATLLVSPPSTVLLEGLQMGVPGICHHAPAVAAFEQDTFDEPLGAFRNTVGAEALAEALAEASTRRGRARDMAEAFLAEHVSTTPGRTMTQRVVDALIEVLDRPREVPST